MNKKDFIEIIKDNKGILYKVIFTYCKNPEDKKDLEQEIVIHLWRSMKSYKEEYKLSTWIYKVAMNVSISFYRSSEKRNKDVSLEEKHIFELETPEDDYYEVDPKKILLRKFIKELDEFNKAVIVLYLENYSYKEISKIIGITETNVATRISRIKKALKIKFNQNKTLV